MPNRATGLVVADEVLSFGTARRVLEGHFDVRPATNAAAAEDARRRRCREDLLSPAYHAADSFAALVQTMRSVGEHVEEFSEEAGGECAATGGEGRERSARVTMRALFGGGRCMDMLAVEQLPRLC